MKIADKTSDRPTPLLSSNFTDLCLPLNPQLTALDTIQINVTEHAGYRLFEMLQSSPVAGYSKCDRIRQLPVIESCNGVCQLLVIEIVTNVATYRFFMCEIFLLVFCIRKTARYIKKKMGKFSTYVLSFQMVVDILDEDAYGEKVAR